MSSGEAEYNGVVKAAGIALGHQSLMAEMGMSANVQVWTDSSAAVGICGSSGLAGSDMCKPTRSGFRSESNQEP